MSIACLALPRFYLGTILFEARRSTVSIHAIANARVRALRVCVCPHDSALAVFLSFILGRAAFALAGLIALSSPLLAQTLIDERLIIQSWQEVVESQLRARLFFTQHSLYEDGERHLQVTLRCHRIGSSVRLDEEEDGVIQAFVKTDRYWLMASRKASSRVWNLTSYGSLAKDALPDHFSLRLNKVPDLVLPYIGSLSLRECVQLGTFRFSDISDEFVDGRTLIKAAFLHEVPARAHPATPHRLTQQGVAFLDATICYLPIHLDVMLTVGDAPGRSFRYQQTYHYDNAANTGLSTSKELVSTDGYQYRTEKSFEYASSNDKPDMHVFSFADFDLPVPHDLRTWTIPWFWVLFVAGVLVLVVGVVVRRRMRAP